jgi:hypothetical protein
VREYGMRNVVSLLMRVFSYVSALFNLSQTCLMGVECGDFVGQAITSMFCC